MDSAETAEENTAVPSTETAEPATDTNTSTVDEAHAPVEDVKPTTEVQEPLAESRSEPPVETVETVETKTEDVEPPAENAENTPPPPSNDLPSTVTEDEAQAMQAILSNVYDHRTTDGHDPSKLFHRKVNRRVVPDYYDVIQEPMALSTIKSKINFKQYKSFSEFVRDFSLIPHNAQVYNRADSQAYHDALEIKRLLESEFKTLADTKLITEEVAALPYLGEIPAQDEMPEEEEDDDEDDEDDDDEGNESDESRKPKRGRGRPRLSEKRGEGRTRDRERDADYKKKRGRPPKVDTPMEARIKNIMKGLRRLKDPQGQHKIYTFDRLPDRTVMPEYYNEIKNPMAVDVLKKKLKRKKYHSVDQFMQDVELMFENAKLFNEDASQIYKDAVELQNEARKVATEEKSKPDSDFVMEDGKLPLPEGILQNGELYKVGDWVHIQNPNDLTKPIVAQLYRTWQDSSGQKYINACWYYRPEQTVHRFDKHFFENEVVKTGQYRDHTVEEIVDRCFVMFVTRFNKGRPRHFPSDKEVYVCESRYNEEKHTFNKIKTWASCLPDEVRDKDYEMDLFPEPKRLKKQPSSIAYLLKDEQKETDPLPKAEWGLDNAPPKIGAVHRRPRDPKDSPPPEPTPSPPPREPTPPPQRPQPTLQTSGLSREQATMQSPGQRISRAPNILSARDKSTPVQMQHQHISPAPLNRQSSDVQMNGFSAHTPQSGYASRPNQPDSFSNVNRHPHNPATAFLNNAANYKAPDPVEVYHLSDTANQAIPAEIREQFQCDEHGRMLFFTAPPLDTRPAQDLDQNGFALGHSARYLAAKIKKEELLREKRKRDEEKTTEDAERKAKVAKEEKRKFDDKLRDLRDKAMDMWEDQLNEATKKNYQELFGDQWEVELQKAMGKS